MTAKYLTLCALMVSWFMASATNSFAAATLPVTIHTAGGVKHYQLEIAATPHARETGLMHRDRMGAADGMLFLFPAAQEQSFWMKNTRIPLDIIYIHETQRILSIARGVPYSLSPIPSGGLVNAVIELDAGRAARDGLVVGNKVVYALPKTVTIH